MAFNDNNSNTYLNLLNQRAANLISNGQTLIPLHALNKYFPSLFNNGRPHIGNASNASQNNSQLYGRYQPSTDFSYNGSNTNLNPTHITNNTNSARNWSNGQSPVGYHHQLHSGIHQQLRYPSDYISANPAPSTTLQGSQLSSVLDAVPPISFTDPQYQYPVQTRSNLNDLPVPYYQNLNGNTMNQNTQSLFGYNPLPLETNNESNSALRPLYNNAACLHDYSDTSHRVVGTDAAVGIGPNMQNVHNVTNHNMTSALSAGAQLPFFSNTSYPTFPAFSSLQNPSEQVYLSFPSHTLYHNYPFPQSSTSVAPSSFSSSFTTSEEDPDNIPGLYQKIGKKAWKCTFGEECTKITYHKRDRTRHIGKHANWEDRQIKAGFLRPTDAIAIPWRQKMIYECDIPDCGYFLETGKKFFVEDYRVDRRKGLHLKRYHYSRDDDNKNVSGKDGEEKVKKRKKNGDRIVKSKNRRETK